MAWQVSLPGEPLGMYLVHNHSIFSVCYGCAEAHATCYIICDVVPLGPCLVLRNVRLVGEAHFS